ncbi:hypothetical protein [Candidatus Mycobacterium methanotrophicum]|uniref:Uncharacterized protein n=1 Tax=Candidatus Mycobacterium methanotrophicum TaxID=2943498 RepID=A0ABY4QID0_9MYCO|nr:hypothetical protein [Candidatus Mycobacterium methanotrophicum]UQX10103.1 hypothetical protein M5I08_18130 [Candidatus Mycobacterium methanotrophicum]
MQEREPAGEAPPAELLLFDGRGLTYDEWVDAYDAWCTAREAWQEQHPGVELPEGVELGECPLDPMLTLECRAWSRAPGEDEMEGLAGEEDIHI